MKTSVKSALVLFVVSPLSALPLIVSSIGKKEFVFYISFFTAVIGLFYTYPVSSDGHTHLQHAMNDYESMSFTSFLSESFKILFFLDGAMKTDLYIHVLSFISVVVIGIPVLMHTIAGLVLGWISAKTLSLLMPRYKGKLDMSIVLVTIFILLSHVVFNLNAIRMGTAVWFLSYGFISKFRLQNKSWFLWIILSVQIHFSIFFLALPVILFSFVQLRASWLFIFWLLSFVIHLNLASLSGYLPGNEVFQSKASDYIMDEGDLEWFENRQSAKEGTFYSILGPVLFYNISIPLLILFFTVFCKESFEIRINSAIYSVVLITNALSNFFDTVPNLSGRLIYISSFFACLLLFSILSYSNVLKAKRNAKYLLNLSVLVSIPFILKLLSHFLLTTEYFFLFMPVFKLLSIGDVVSIRELLGNLW